MQWFQPCFHFSVHVWHTRFRTDCIFHVVISCISTTSWLVSPSGKYIACRSIRICRDRNLVSTTDGEPLVFSAWPRIPCGMVQFHGAEARHLKLICNTVSNEIPSPRHCRMVLYTVSLIFHSWKRNPWCNKSSKSKTVIMIVLISDRT